MYFNSCLEVEWSTDVNIVPTALILTTQVLSRALI